jgi:hypothetical protein
MTGEPGDWMLEQTYEASQTLRWILHANLPPLTPQTVESELHRLASVVSMTAQLTQRTGQALRRGMRDLDLDLYLAAEGRAHGVTTPDQAVAGALGHIAAAWENLDRAMTQLSEGAARLTWVGYNTEGDVTDDREGDGL